MKNSNYSRLTPRTQRTSHTLFDSFYYDSAEKSLRASWETKHYLKNTGSNKVLEKEKYLRDPEEIHHGEFSLKVEKVRGKNLAVKRSNLKGGALKLPTKISVPEVNLNNNKNINPIRTKCFLISSPKEAFVTASSYES